MNGLPFHIWNNGEALVFQPHPRGYKLVHVEGSGDLPLPSGVAYGYWHRMLNSVYSIQELENISGFCGLELGELRACTCGSHWAWQHCGISEFCG